MQCCCCCYSAARLAHLGLLLVAVASKQEAKQATALLGGLLLHSRASTIQHHNMQTSQLRLSLKQVAYY